MSIDTGLSASDFSPGGAIVKAHVITINGPVETSTAICTSAQASQRLLQGVRHSKPTEVVEEIKAQLKDKVQPAGNPLADVILAAGKDKLSKKPDDKQTDLTSE